MALFAQSLNTLKKRATNLANELVKGDEKKRAEAADIGQPSAEAQHALRGFVADGPQSGGGGSFFAADGPVVVRYEVQNGDDGERELAAFPLPSMPAALTLGHVRKHFPVPGRYHFRFKAPSLDGGFGGFIWMDVANDGEVVPFFRGDICMKALRLPDVVAVRSAESLPNSTLAAAAMASTSLPPGSAAASPEMSPDSTPPARAPSPDAVSFEQSSPPQQFRPQLQTPLPPQPQQLFQQQQQQQPQRPLASPPRSEPSSPPAGPVGDLMDFGGANMMASQSVPAGHSVPSPPLSGSASPPSPPVVLDREKLRAEREAREQQRVRDAANRQAEQQRKEEQLKADKVSEGNKLDAEMTAWAKTSDGQAYKDIKVLLSTMHNVTWSGCPWKELPLSELMSGPGTVKKFYRKAILVCHPDKQTEADPEQQVRADRIFQALNEAFKISGDQ